MSYWLLVTTIAGCGALYVVLPLVPRLTVLGAAHYAAEPSVALAVQGLVLWFAGSSDLAVYGSLAAGLAAMWIAMKFRARKEGGDGQHRDAA